MPGIVSLIPPAYSSQVVALWNDLYAEFGLQGVQVTPYPHIAWQIAQEYDYQRLRPVLEEIAGRTPALTIRTAGISLFTGPRPIVSIAIVKTIPLMQVQAELWERTQAAAADLSPRYHPEAWMPHITLAFEDVSQENVSSIIGNLGFRPFAWEMKIDNLTVMRQPVSQPPGSTSEPANQYPLTGEINDPEENKTAP